MGWEDQAGNWLAWARTPGHDAYWSYRDAFFPLLPAPGRRTLEVGCGEGRVARDLAARGHRVVGLDTSPALLRHAAAAHTGGRYVCADAAALPFGDAEFDLVVAYNSLMDVEDMPGSVREAGRVLEPGGHLGFYVTHPFMDAGQFASREPDAAFVVSGSYLGARRPYEGTFARAGLEITFRGWCYSLEAYARAFEAAGFLVQTLREPDDPRDGPRQGRRLPWFLMGRCVRPR
jgi:ubiquinone/menaquinone biosynthesis C-methylase UbiE